MLSTNQPLTGAIWNVVFDVLVRPVNSKTPVDMVLPNKIFTCLFVKLWTLFSFVIDTNILPLVVPDVITQPTEQTLELKLIPITLFVKPPDIVSDKYNSSPTLNADVLTSLTTPKLVIKPIVLFGMSWVATPATSATLSNAAFDKTIVGRPNDELYDVDFSSNAIVAVNGQNIISASRGTGSATPASVPESNYTTLRSANPRYFGCENTSPAINIGSGSSLPVVEQLGRFALVYKGAGKSDNLVPNSTTFFNITTGVDEDGNLYQPQTSSAYEWNALNVFGKDDIINVVVQNSSSVSQTTLTTLQGNQTVNSLFEFPNSFLTTTSASGFNIFDYPPANTGSIYLIDETNQVGTFVNAPYWATSSATPFTITASTAGGLGFYLNEAISGTANWTQIPNTNRQGLNNPIDNIVPRIGDLFYHPNFELPFTVTGVSVGGGEFAITFNKPITSPSDTAAELNKFVFVRNYQNLNRINLNINISGSNPQVGSGVIFTQKETQKFIDNFSTITSNLISKNLL